MKQNRTLRILGELPALRDLIRMMPGALEPPWELGKPIPVHGDRSWLMYPIALETPIGHRPAQMFLEEVPATEGLSELVVTNIVPNRGERLTVDEFNSALELFFRCCVAPHSTTLSLRAVMGKANPVASDWAGPECAQVLGEFSELANRAQLHIDDRNRFLQFIICVHRSRRDVAPTQVEQFLVDSGWTKRRSRELAAEFGSGLELLRRFEQSSARAR